MQLVDLPWPNEEGDGGNADVCCGPQMEAGDTVASPRVAGVKRKSSVSDGEHAAKASRSSGGGGGSDGSKREKVNHSRF